MHSMNSTKISINATELSQIIKEYKALGRKVVMTNGCFDLLHRGHVEYLEKSKSLGDILVVAVNSDASVKRLKGESRPINKAEDRAAVLAGLSSVDHIIIFEEDTPLNLVKKLLPDILAKGGDYKLEEIIGAKEVKNNGGEVTIIDFLEGFSASSIIHKINDQKKSQ